MRDEVFNAVLKAKQNNERSFYPRIAKQYGYASMEALRCQFKREKRKRGVRSISSDNVDFNENMELQRDGNMVSDRLIEICEVDLKDPVRVLQAHNFDPKLWEIISCRNNLWHSQRPKDAGLNVMYQSRLVVRPKAINDIDYADIMEMFKKKEHIAPLVIKSPKYSKSDETLEIDVCDLHFGSDANHSPEDRFERAISDVISRVGDRKFDKIYLALIADIFHYDTFLKTTTAGTTVSTDGMSAYDIFDLGIDSFVRVISKLSEVAPIEVAYVSGNHDRMSGYYLVKTLEAFFKDNKNVVFDSEHKSRKYRVIGNSLVGWMHGDMPKGRAIDWLQVEAREEWGRTRYSEIHAGHYHHQEGKEGGGTVLRYLPALTNTDQWHYDKGFVGAVRSMTSFVWHKELGLREIWYSTVE